MINTSDRVLCEAERVMRESSELKAAVEKAKAAGDGALAIS
jgi:hypothetical protein